MSTSIDSPLAVACFKLFDFIDSITLNNLIQTNLCDWNNMFTNDQLLSKYLQHDEIKNRMNYFKLQWELFPHPRPRLKLYYVLNIDVLNANVNSSIDIEILLSYYVWHKFYGRDDTSLYDNPLKIRLLKRNTFRGAGCETLLQGDSLGRLWLSLPYTLPHSIY